jgi:hypothetical protein
MDKRPVPTADDFYEETYQYTNELSGKDDILKRFWVHPRPLPQISEIKIKYFQRNSESLN